MRGPWDWSSTPAVLWAVPGVESPSVPPRGACHALGSMVRGLPFQCRKSWGLGNIERARGRVWLVRGGPGRSPLHKDWRGQNQEPSRCLGQLAGRNMSVCLGCCKRRTDPGSNSSSVPSPRAAGCRLEAALRPEIRRGRAGSS